MNFEDFSQYSVLIPIGVGLIYFKNLPAPFRTLLFFLILSLFTESIADLLKATIGNNQPALHIFTVIEFMIFSHILCIEIFSKDFSENLSFVLFVSFIVIAFIDAFVVHTPLESNTIARPIESVILIILSLLYFYKILEEMEYKPVFRQPMFWISSAVLIYFSSNFFTFMMMNILVDEHVNYADMGIRIHAIINVIAYFFYAISFRCFPKLSQS